MTWRALLELIADEVGKEAAARIEARARKEYGGARLTVSKRKVLTVEIIDATAPGKPVEAARKLGVHHSTVYRAIRRRPMSR